VVPLAGATLKLSRAISSPCKLIFLAHVLGISLTPLQLATFTVTILLISPATPGIPRVTSGMNSLPAYVAAGIPAEYVVLLGAVTGLTDVLMTVLNATGYMTSNVIVARLATVWTREAADVRGGSAPVEREPAAMPAATH
jgi:Na+/H+-dicarboxylate symporter